MTGSPATDTHLAVQAEVTTHGTSPYASTELEYYEEDTGELFDPKDQHHREMGFMDTGGKTCASESGTSTYVGRQVVPPSQGRRSSLEIRYPTVDGCGR